MHFFKRNMKGWFFSIIDAKFLVIDVSSYRNCFHFPLCRRGTSTSLWCLSRMRTCGPFPSLLHFSFNISACFKVTWLDEVGFLETLFLFTFFWNPYEQIDISHRCQVTRKYTFRVKYWANLALIKLKGFNNFTNSTKWEEFLIVIFPTIKGIVINFLFFFLSNKIRYGIVYAIQQQSTYQEET